MVDSSNPLRAWLILVLGAAGVLFLCSGIAALFFLPIDGSPPWPLVDRVVFFVSLFVILAVLAVIRRLRAKDTQIR
jgi:hypothetical protein